MRSAVNWAVGVLCALMLSLTPAAANRVALVVGIDTYDNFSPDLQLKKAVNDARAVAATFKELGFQVITAENVKRDAFLKAWQRFLDTIQPGDVTVLYFAGHGFEINSANYVLTRDAPTPADGQEVLKGSAIRIANLMDRLREQQPQVSVYIIDACRNSPYANKGITRSIGSPRGLSREEPPRGSLVMMSAGTGQEALDGLAVNDPNPNSIYTRTLVPLMKEPGLEITELARRVRSEVEALAASVHHEQRPAFYHELSGNFYLMPQEAAPVARIAPTMSEATQAWYATKDTTSPAVLEAFLRQFGDTAYAGMARARLEELKKVQTAAVVPPVRMAPAPAAPSTATPAVGVIAPPSTHGAAAPLSATAERALKPKDNFQECAKCPEMVVIPAGSFTMGSPATEEGRSKVEGPEHQVTIAKPFAIGKFAVTFDEWEACVVAGGCNGYRPADIGRLRGRHPVVNVSWEDAKAYVTWLAKVTGKPYRLLSEAEREYVARAGTPTPFWWGASISVKQANYDGSSTYGGGEKGEYRQRALPVDSFTANPWGVFQTTGNVYDWVEDCYHGSYQGAPADGTAWTDGDCGRRVLRGGSWYDPAIQLRAAARAAFYPGYRDTKIGFRVARPL